MKIVKYAMALLILGVGLNSAWAQNSHDEIIHKFLEQRKNMMEDIMKAFDDDEFFKDDFFDDEMMDALKQFGLGGFKGFQGRGNNISVQERMEKDGSISVVITPKQKDAKLDIVTKENSIVIKSEVKVEEENVQGQSRSKTISTRSFSQSVAIPQGYKAQNPKKEGESIVISLVPNKKNILKPDNKGRMPIQKAPGEETI